MGTTWRQNTLSDKICHQTQVPLRCLQPRGWSQFFLSPPVTHQSPRIDEGNLSWHFLALSWNANPGAELLPRACLASSLPPSPRWPGRSRGDRCSPLLLSSSRAHDCWSSRGWPSLPFTLSTAASLAWPMMVGRSRWHRRREEGKDSDRNGQPSPLLCLATQPGTGFCRETPPSY